MAIRGRWWVSTRMPNVLPFVRLYVHTMTMPQAHREFAVIYVAIGVDVVPMPLPDPILEIARVATLQFGPNVVGLRWRGRSEGRGARDEG